jgi:hypothetical protein
MRQAPAQATIAALSVQKLGGGTWNVYSEASHSLKSAVRKVRLEATPPAATSFFGNPAAS